MRLPESADRMVATLVRPPTLVAFSVFTGVAFVVTLVVRPSQCPVLVRWYFERAGGGVVKVGQLLATRFDLLPPRYCEELGRLLDDLPAVAAARIVEVIEADLGRPMGELFRSFDPEPLATASLAQAHAAVLPTGEAVVVKVLKPGVQGRVRTDLVVLRALARLLALVPGLARLDLPLAIGDVCRLAEEELDFRREASNLELFHREMAKSTLPHYAPAVYRERCGADVLTMERIQGVSVRELISAVVADDRSRLAAWEQRGITPETTARLLFRSVLEQSMGYRIYNCDPHPSNLIVSDGGQLNWIDFGLVGWMDERQWLLQLRIRQAFSKGLVHRAYQLFLESVGPLPPGNLRRFEADLKEAIWNYIRSARDPQAPIQERSTGVFLVGTLRALRRNGLSLSVETMQLYRAILIADIVMLRLSPGIDWLAELDEFLVEVVSDQTRTAVRAVVDDPDLYSLVLSAPLALLNGIDDHDRRRLTRGTTPSSASIVRDSAVGPVRAVALVSVAGLAYLAAVAMRLIPPDTVDWLASPAGVADRHPILTTLAGVVWVRWWFGVVGRVSR